MGNCSGGDDPALKHSRGIDEELKRSEAKQKSLIKILLLGPGESGKSTIFKQFKILQDDTNGGFTQAELSRYKTAVFANTITQMVILLMGAQKSQMRFETRSQMELAISFLTKVQQLNQTIFEENTAWSPELARAIQQLWSSKVLKALYYKHDNKIFEVNDSADYFFDIIDRMIEPNYIPTVQDALRVRLRSTGIEEATFKFGEDYYKVMDVGGQRSERTKWKSCFDCVTSVLYVAGLSEYDQVLRENEQVNRLVESLHLFEDVTNSDIFKKASIILFLNKTDLFEKKLKIVPLSQYYPSFQGGDNFDLACQFMQKRFQEVASPARLTSLYIHFTCAVDTESVGKIIRDMRQQLIDTVTRQNNYI